MKATLILLSILSAALLADVALYLPPFTAGERLPLSISNEAGAAAERGRDWLLSRQNADGTWTLSGGERTCWPALAFTCGGERPAAVEKSVAHAAAWVAERLPKVLTDAERSEFAFATLLLASVDAEPALREKAERKIRLEALRQRADADSSAAIDRTALMVDACTESRPGRPRLSGWTQFNRFAFPPQPVRDTDAASPEACAVHALHLLAEAHRDAAAKAAETGKDGGSADARAEYSRVRAPVVAMLRRIRQTVVEADAALAPSGEWWVLRLLDMVPASWRTEAGIPMDWRSRTADRVISSQQWSDGGGRWSGGENPDAALWETTCAIWILETL